MNTKAQLKWFVQSQANQKNSRLLTAAEFRTAAELKVNKGRTVPMDVLCLGMCRTGTQSLADGLTILGYAPIYHMREVKKNNHVENWVKAFEAKFEGQGKPPGREEFDEFLGGWAGVTDIPAALFYEELMAAYPDAKIIFTTRDEDKWFESMKLTIWHSKHPSVIGDFVQKYVWGGNPDEFGIANFRKHNENVRALATAKGREILEYQVKEGWEPLCKFLGKEVPEEGFPHSDDWAAYKKRVVEEMEAKKVAQVVEEA